MNLKSYRENVSQQIDFLEKLKEKASDDAKKTIDATLDLIYKDVSKKITPAEIEKFIPRNQSARTPPMADIGTAV